MKYGKALSAHNPTLARQWHKKKNGYLTPRDVTPGSPKKVWWRCEKGHEWQATIQSRNHGANCPYCTGQKPIPGLNDLATTNPELAAEWHPTKNGDLTPSDVSYGSGKKVWWICENGHEWQATVNSRSTGNDCPYCSRRKTLSGFNDLATTNPELAAEWHPTKNGYLTPRDVTPGSPKKVWWRCEKGHEWQATIQSRNHGANCPYCSGKKTLSGYNDLPTKNPELAAEWHPTKNGDLTPSDVTPFSDKKVWWRCEKGHEWQAVVGSRSVGSGCPYCSGRNALSGVNDLVTIKPEIAAEWHPTKNGYLTPSDVTPFSGKKVWWRCEKGHEWEARVSNRSLRDQGCPHCAGKKTLSGYNDLATINPELTAEWHPTKNGDLTPRDVTPGSQKKVWWRCENGHEWQATVGNRSIKGSGCPYCYALRIKTKKS